VSGRRTLLFEGITNRMMCIRSDGIGSPLSIMVNILFMVSTLDFSESAPDRTKICIATEAAIVEGTRRDLWTHLVCTLF
jgi:hypothetical protein